MIESILRNNNIKITKQRVQIVEFIINKNEFSIKELDDKFKEINQSTIYRMLSLFEDKKIIIKIIDDNKIYYKFNNEEHKHYLECIRCHKKEELEECPFNKIDLKGYMIKDDEAIKGICKSCQKIKIGLFVGSFNPVTKAHLEIGNLLLQKNIIDSVIYIPCNNQAKNNLTSLEDRVNMLHLITSNNSKMFVDNFKLNDYNKNFHGSDLDLLKEKYLTKTFYIIIGSDNLQQLYKWDNYPKMLKENYFIVINRFKNLDLEVIKDKYHEFKDKFIIVDYNNEISSTNVREMIKDNSSLNEVLDNNVIKYINKHKLYK